MKENPYKNLDDQAGRIAYLIAGFIRNTLSEQEHNELDDWVNESDANMLLFEELTDEQNLKENLEWMDGVNSAKAFENLQQSGAFQLDQQKKHYGAFWLVAASVSLVIALWFLLQNKGKEEILPFDKESQTSVALQPGSNKAVLTLADGKQVDLAIAPDRLIQLTGTSHVQKPADGELVYGTGSISDVDTGYHTLSTPTGGQFKLTLPDGTRVWLNAATTLRYPAVFNSKERVVSLQGEAYFDVARNESLPFRVLLNENAGVTVLGTEFNIRNYQNDSASDISLVEGKVSVRSNNNAVSLEPGTQASIKGNSVHKNSTIDLEEVTAWKDGLFVFHDATIETIMKQVERWYDAEVVYESEIRQLFNATIQRNEPLPKLLHLLELTGHVHFKIKNKTIYVLP